MTEVFEKSLAFAKSLDARDELRSFKEKFFIPQKDGKDVTYLCGNSLGLQPRSAEKYLQEELEAWRKNGVEGHFTGARPWMQYHKNFQHYWNDILGANPQEVVVMNNLTVNIHLLMVSFYRPTAKKNKILMEGHAFPSDNYALDSQVRWHGLLPEDTIVRLFPREGEHTLRTEDILQKIADLGDTLALSFFSGVQYYTGQFFDMGAITAAAHKCRALVGFDLAHAVGNVPLALHDWGVDFATWCSYKYLNSGPGSVSGAYIHEKYATDTSILRFAGWWGHDETTRFQMGPDFHPTPTAEGWQLSNAPIFSMAAHLASLEIFKEATMPRLRAKSEQLSAYLLFLLNSLACDAFDIITPFDSKQRGCQTSLLFRKDGKKVFEYLSKKGIVGDWREPNVIRIAAVPLYNTFEDVFHFYESIAEALTQNE